MKKIKIGIDKKTELMSVLLYISNYRKEFPNLILYNKEIPYVRDVFEHFSQFSKHRAVVLLNEIIEKLNFSYDAPYILISQLNDDFSVGELKDYPFRSRLKESHLVLDFLSEIKGFVQESGFEEFFKKHGDSYKRWLDEFKSKIDLPYLDKFEEFYRIKTNRNYTINLLPMTGYGGAYYDFRANDNYVVHIRNNHKDEIRFDGGDWSTGRVFCVYSTSLLRQIIETKKLSVPLAKEFQDIMKNSYTSINNIQYVCFEIARVLECVFHDEACPNGEKRDVRKVNNENPERAKKISDILRVWREKGGQLDDFLQEILNLFQ